MTEEEFYKLKIFYKVSLRQIKRDYTNFIELIKKWYKSERYSEIQDLKNFLSNKLKQQCKNSNFEFSYTNEQLYDLFQWYESAPKICAYCGLPENKLEELNKLPNHINKRYPHRGTSLEIDRKQSQLAYINIENLVLACYWCNNAKTDTFTHSEFSKIGIVIKEIWTQRFKLKSNKINK